MIWVHYAFKHTSSSHHNQLSFVHKIAPYVADPQAHLSAMEPLSAMTVPAGKSSDFILRRTCRVWVMEIKWTNKWRQWWHIAVVLFINELKSNRLPEIILLQVIRKWCINKNLIQRSRRFTRSVMVGHNESWMNVKTTFFQTKWPLFFKKKYFWF